MTVTWRCPRCNSTLPPKAYACPICRQQFDVNYEPIDWEDIEDNRMGYDDFRGMKN